MSGRSGGAEAEASELREALLDLRTEIRGVLAERVERDAPPSRLASASDCRSAEDVSESATTRGSSDPLAGLPPEVDPPRGERFFSIFDELRSQLSGLSASPRSGEVDEFGLDRDALAQARGLLDFLFDRYWRVAVAGEAHLPSEGPCLFVANRSGLLPYDGLMLAHALERARPGWPRPRFLVADWLMTLPFAQPRLARLGGVRACPENAERLLLQGHSVIAFPEGVKGAAKVFRDRYRLQRFGRGGAIRSALRTRVPLIPVAIVGAEEAHPILFKSDSVATRAFGLPFLPVTPTFPLLGPLGLLPLPTRWRISIGEPMSLPDLQGDESADELEVARMNEMLRARVQSLLDGALSDRQG
jgi:1-acyl-sn-glycerol-3-phosphate acyltransferase